MLTTYKNDPPLSVILQMLPPMEAKYRLEVKLDIEVHKLRQEEAARPMAVQNAPNLSTKQRQLIYLVLQEANRKNVSYGRLPMMKAMSYKQLVEYVHDQWPQLRVYL